MRNRAGNRMAESQQRWSAPQRRMLLPMTKTNLSTRKTVFGTTKQQEAFAKLCVLEGIPAVDAVKQVYSTTTHAASCTSKLLASPYVVARIEQLENQQAIIQSLSRDSLTSDSIQIQREARADGKYSAAVAATRLAGDLQGLTQSNPIAEATATFLAFLAGSDKPAVGDVRVLDEGVPGSS